MFVILYTIKQGLDLKELRRLAAKFNSECKIYTISNEAGARSRSYRGAHWLLLVRLTSVRGHHIWYEWNTWVGELLVWAEEGGGRGLAVRRRQRLLGRLQPGFRRFYGLLRRLLLLHLKRVERDILINYLLAIFGNFGFTKLSVIATLCPVNAGCGSRSNISVWWRSTKR